MGFAWLARQNLISTYGTGAGTAIAEYDFLNTLPANNTGILDAVDQVFLLDDDDGDLSNGTPHYVSLYNAALAKKFKSPGPVLDTKQWAPQPIFPPGPAPGAAEGARTRGCERRRKVGFPRQRHHGLDHRRVLRRRIRRLGRAGRNPSVGEPVGDRDRRLEPRLEARRRGRERPRRHDRDIVGKWRGGFAPAGSAPAGFHPSHLVAADINQDGMLDLVGTNSAAVNSVTLWLGMPSGNSSAPVFYTGATAPSGLDVRDLNGDGHPDVVVASASPASGAGRFK